MSKAHVLALSTSVAALILGATAAHAADPVVAADKR